MKGEKGRRFYIKSYGCQMNVYDSDKMADILTSEGYARVFSKETADVIILNTCHVREKATEKVFSEIGRLRTWKNEKERILVVAGCVAQAEGDLILQRFFHVDLVVGPQTYYLLPRLLASPDRKVALDFTPRAKFDALGGVRRGQALFSAFVAVQEGCDKFCTYCVVPYTRGAEYARDPDQIVEEVDRLLERGVGEVTLLGQNVNGWIHRKGKETLDFAHLLERVAGRGVKRLRYMTSHPRHLNDRLIAVHRDISVLAPYLHLPLQSGSDRILRRMNRQYTLAQYRRGVEKLRLLCPNIALSSDFIVGFPGETEGDHRETLRAVEAIGYANYYAFKYSPRPGTPAANFPDQLPEEVKKRRLTELMALLEKQRQAFDLSCVGQTIPVLLEKPGRHEDQVKGRSPWLQSVQVEGTPELFGKMRACRITGVGGHSLFGSVV